MEWMKRGAPLALLVLLLAGCSGIPGGPRSPDQVTDDKKIEVNLGKLFLADPDLRLRKFHIECTRGVVVLSGVLISEDERKRALGLPRSLGVAAENIVDRFEVRAPKPGG